MIVESSFFAQNTPGDASELVGQGDGKLVPVHSLCRSFEPSAKAIAVPVLRTHQKDLRGLDKECPEILAAAL